MAMVSAFGFGGTDHLNTLFEQRVNMASSREMARYNSGLQYDYAKKYSLNGPSWNRQGYEKAGLNPIAFMANGSAGNVYTPSVNNSAPQVGVGDSGFSMNEFQASKNSARRTNMENEIGKATKNNIDAQAEAARKQGDAALISAKAAERNSKTNIGTAVEHGLNNTMSTALDTANTVSYINRMKKAEQMLTGAGAAGAGAAGAKAASSVAARVGSAASTTGAAASKSILAGLPALAAAGSLGLGSAGAYYALGKAIEMNMTKKDHQDFDKVAKRNVRSLHEAGQMFKSKNPKRNKRRHN